MLTAHIKGSAYVQTLPRMEAEKRVQRAHQAAELEGYPLHFSVERE
jgi:ATP-dependent Clp protease adapter protein ClpS